MKNTILTNTSNGVIPFFMKKINPSPLVKGEGLKIIIFFKISMLLLLHPAILLTKDTNTLADTATKTPIKA